MSMYGIRDRSPFITQNQYLQGTMEGSSVADSGLMRRYYSSLDAEIYFGSMYIDEIVYIDYEVMQQNLPLYGCQSYTFDEMATGSRIIQGSFAINFVRPNYLLSVLDVLEGETNPRNLGDVIKEDEGELPDSYSRASDGVVDKTGSNSFTSTDYRGTNKTRSPMYYTGFDIDLMLGQETERSEAKHIMLEGVYINSNRVALSTEGEPISEVYTFMARDIRHMG